MLVDNVFNYPTLAEAYKAAAHNAVNIGSNDNVARTLPSSVLCRQSTPTLDENQASIQSSSIGIHSVKQLSGDRGDS